MESPNQMMRLRQMNNNLSASDLQITQNYFNRLGLGGNPPKQQPSATMVRRNPNKGFSLPGKAPQPPVENSELNALIMRVGAYAPLSIFSYVLCTLRSRRLYNPLPTLAIPLVLGATDHVVEYTIKKIDTLFPDNFLLGSIKDIYHAALYGSTFYAINKYVWRVEGERYLDYIVQPSLIIVARKIIDLTIFGTQKILGARPDFVKNNPDISFKDRLRRYLWKPISFCEKQLDPVAKRVDQVFSFCLSIRTINRLTKEKISEDQYSAFELLRSELLKGLPLLIKDVGSTLAGCYVAANLGYSVFFFRATILFQIGRWGFYNFSPIIPKLFALIMVEFVAWKMGIRMDGEDMKELKKQFNEHNKENPLPTDPNELMMYVMKQVASEDAPPPMFQFDEKTVDAGLDAMLKRMSTECGAGDNPISEEAPDSA